ncbi:MAG TPA: SufD family Fe-S cluster assembly protein, partial [Acidimicrobiales bacterium]|nr:SufD family Fe-S cluster assembly protein [Acidimicrobiales bacterium]
NSSATVIEIFASPTWESPGHSLLSIPVTELFVGKNAQLGFVSIQDLGPHVWQVAYQASRVDRDARLTSFSVALGGDYARQRTDSHAVGPGAETNLLAAYFGTGTQVHDFRTLQDHVSPHTTSNLYFKGAVGDTARSVYSGLIKVRKGAIRTNAFQDNRNLVLSEGAHAESVPNLDIEENDVRCSHASAVGPVDPQQSYYLQSRGIPPQEAEQLVVEGFFEDIVARMPGADAAKILVRRKVAAKLREQF